MALNGSFPVLLLYLDQTLTAAETKELVILEGQKELDETDTARLKELQEAAKSGGNNSTTTPIPIVLDGQVIKAVPDSYNTQMIKSFATYGGDPVITSTLNTVSVNIETQNQKKGLSAFSDVLFGLADFYASQYEALPKISYFGGSVVIDRGYLIRLSRSQSQNNESEIITLEIQRDVTDELSTLAYQEDTTEAVTEIDTSGTRVETVQGL